MNDDVVSAVDLGSNSFRLQIGRVAGQQICTEEVVRETVRLASGLNNDNQLDDASRTRGLSVLTRFRAMLQDHSPDKVRAVATNTLRIARNANNFLQEAEAALGFPIEVISGKEEARLIYLGAAHAVPAPHKKRLVVDIGGGSTELIIGYDYKPEQLESLHMGCVNYSRHYFPEGIVNEELMRKAEMAAGRELQSIQHYPGIGWEEAVGSSGTAKALVDLLELNALNPAGSDGITFEGLKRLCEELYLVGSVSRLELKGLREDRIPVLPGGLAIMLAVFRELELEQMMYSEGALLLGILHELLGDNHRHETTTANT